MTIYSISFVFSAATLRNVSSISRAALRTTVIIVITGDGCFTGLKLVSLLSGYFCFQSRLVEVAFDFLVEEIAGYKYRSKEKREEHDICTFRAGRSEGNNGILNDSKCWNSFLIFGLGQLELLCHLAVCVVSQLHFVFQSV